MACRIRAMALSKRLCRSCISAHSHHTVARSSADLWLACVAFANTSSALSRLPCASYIFANYTHSVLGLPVAFAGSTVLTAST